MHIQCTIRSGHEGQTILAYASEQHCDLLIIGSQGHVSVWGTALGGTAEKLVGHTSRSLLVVRETPGQRPYRHLLVALDGSPLSWQAFKVSIHLAKALGASLRAVSVIEGPPTPPADPLTSSSVAGERAPHWDWHAYFQQTQMLVTARAALAEVPIDVTTREGHASSVLIEVARAESSDLLILGATGLEHPWSATTGGTARRVANEAPCAMLLFSPPSMATAKK